MEGAPLRVLFLHGLRQNGDLLRSRLEPLTRRLARLASFHFPDAPHELPLEAGQDVAVRAWHLASECSSSALASALRAEWELHGPFNIIAGFSQGAFVAHLAACLTEPPFCELRGAVFVGGYDGGADLRPPPSLASLHVMGSCDESVLPEQSRQLAARYTRPAVHLHAGGHVVPLRAADVEAVEAFLLGLAGGGGGGMCRPRPPPSATAEKEQVPYAVSEAQAEELTALASIFGDEEYELITPNPPRFRVRLAWTEEPPRPWLFACFTFTPEYLAEPGALPAVRVDTSERGQLPAGPRAALLRALQAALAEGAEGEPRCFAAATAGREWAEAHCSGGPPGSAAAAATAAAAAASDDEEEEAAVDRWWDREEIEEADVEAAAAAAARAEVAHGGTLAGREAGSQAHARSWRFLVGLVGKPSAGKSTLFNAASRPVTEAATAKMAPHPFTTIEPNLGFAFASAPCPCGRLGLAAECAPAHGKPGLPGCHRRLPVVLKDVAGLVPGAYQGRGRGNAFLDDLVDCDVLIHVVDASGSTDAEGQPGKGDPLRDVAWVRAELHAWIFSNLRAKWGVLRKRAMPKHAGADPDAPLARLCQLLSGYRATRATVLHAMARCGLDPGRLTDQRIGIPAWTCVQVHLLVANLLRVRFPILLALNKADLPTSAAFIAKLRAALPGEPAEPVSAAAEWWLARNERHVAYAEGAGDASLRPGAPPDVAARLQALRGSVFGAWAGTGVLRAVSRAVLLRNPLFAFPVIDLRTCVAPARRRAARGALAPSSMAAHIAGGGEGDVEEEEEEEEDVEEEAEAEVDGPPGVLRECVLLRPGTTLTELFSALGREGLVANEFVRAERIVLPAEGAVAAGAAPPETRVMHKEDALPYGCLVLKIATNRKAAWQANTEGRRVVKEKPKKGAGGPAPQSKVVPLEGKTEVFRFQRRKTNFSNQ